MEKQKNKAVPTVQITIYQGTVQSVSKPRGIKLEIHDYDVEHIDPEGDSRCKQDEDGSWFQELIWEENEKVSE